MRLPLIAVLFASVFVVACGQELSADDYDQSCEEDEECTAIYEGDPCASGCTCDNVAINVSDRDTYDADREAAVCVMPELVQCECAAQDVVCRSGKCEIR